MGATSGALVSAVAAAIGLRALWLARRARAE